MPDSRKSANKKLEMSSVFRGSFNVTDEMVENYPLYAVLETEGIKICLAHLNGLSITKIGEHLEVDRRHVARVLSSSIGKAFIAHIQCQFVASAKSRIYKNLDTAMAVIETILNSETATNSDKLKAAIFLLEKALPSIETQKDLEMASDPDYQIIEHDRVQLLLDKLSKLIETPNGLRPKDYHQIEDVESTRKLLNG